MYEGASQAARGYCHDGVSPITTGKRRGLIPMKTFTRTLCGAAALLAASTALAGPPVEVTFRNLGTEPVKLQLTNANETSTYQIAVPTPAQEVQPGSSITFRVQRLVSPDTNGAMLRYSVGRKVCAFSTTFVMMMSGGVKQPKWNKTATPTGGATCTAVNSGFSANYSWRAEFTMK